MDHAGGWEILGKGKINKRQQDRKMPMERGSPPTGLIATRPKQITWPRYVHDMGLNWILLFAIGVRNTTNPPKEICMGND